MYHLSKEETDSWLESTIKPLVTAGKLTELYLKTWRDDIHFRSACIRYGKSVGDWRAVLLHCGMTDPDYGRMKEIQRTQAFEGKRNHSKEDVDEWLSKKIKPLIQRKEWAKLAPSRWRADSHFSTACTMYGSERRDWKGVLAHFCVSEADYVERIARAHIERMRNVSKEEVDRWLDRRIRPLVELGEWSKLSQTDWSDDPHYHTALSFYGGFSGWRGVLLRLGASEDDCEKANKAISFSKEQIDSWLGATVIPLINRRRWDKLSRAAWSDDPHFHNACRRYGSSAFDWYSVLRHCGAAHFDIKAIKHTTQSESGFSYTKQEIDRWLDKRIKPLIRRKEFDKLAFSRWRKDPHFHSVCHRYGRSSGWAGVLLHCGMSDEDCRMVFHEARANCKRLFSRKQIERWLRKRIIPLVRKRTLSELSLSDWMDDPHFHTACKMHGKTGADWRSVLVHCSLPREDYALVRKTRVAFTEKEINDWLDEKINPLVAEKRLSELTRARWMSDPHFYTACYHFGEHQQDWRSVLSHCGVSPADYKKIVGISCQIVTAMRIKETRKKVDRWLAESVVPSLEGNALPALSPSRWIKGGYFSSACLIYGQNNNDWRSVVAHCGVLSKSYDSFIRLARLSNALNGTCGLSKKYLEEMGKLKRTRIELVRNRDSRDILEMTRQMRIMCRDQAPDGKKALARLSRR